MRGNQNQKEEVSRDDHCRDEGVNCKTGTHEITNCSLNFVEFKGFEKVSHWFRQIY